MPKWDKPYWALMTFYVGLSFFPLAMPFTYRVDRIKDPRLEVFPLNIGDWRGRDGSVDERTYEILETRNVLSRIYENPAGEQIQLLLVGSHKDRRVAHPPEVCYLSSHFTLTDQGQARIPFGSREVPVKEFLAKSEKDPRHQERVLYFYKVGNRFTTNYYYQQLQFAWDQLTRGDSQVLLIRLAARQKTHLREFLAQLLPHLK